MITQVLHCPYCQGTDIVRHGTSAEGKQRYRCRECRLGRGRTFLLDYTYIGQSPEVKQQIVDMAINASGIRDTARVLHVSPTTVINGRCFKSVDPVSDCSPKLVPIDEEPNHQIVHLFRLGETDRATDQSLDPRP